MAAAPPPADTTRWRAFLSHPASATTLLDTLALLTWATWVVFALDTLRAAPVALQARSQPGTPRVVVAEPHDGIEHNRIITVA